MVPKLVRRIVLPHAVALLLAAAALAQGSDSYFANFEPTGEWLLEVEGRDVPLAEILESKAAGSILVMSTELESPVLIDIRGKSAATLNLLKVYERPDGQVDLLDDAILKPQGTLTIQNRTDAHFRVDGRAMALKPRPYLLGAKYSHELLASNAGYRWRAKRYEPDADAIRRLRAERRDVRVLTFFGSWCPHCKEHVPLLLKTEQRLGEARIHFDYHGLPQGSFASDAEAVRWKVSSVPTAVVFIDGVEAGRIPLPQWSNPEIALDLILHPPKS